MNWSDLPRDPSPRLLRQFAALCLVFFGGAAVWQGAVRGRVELAAVLAALAVTIGPLGLVKPRAVRPIFVGWVVLVFPLNWLVSHLFLGLIYYGLFTPTGLLFRLMGRDVLLRQRPSDRPTYWSPKPQPDDVRRYFSQF
jgi:Saxitoxin biosynthesis operon protein SxtJ